VSRRYSTRIGSGAPASLAGKRVVFHGINKSGSLAMANVLFEAYRHHGREKQFHSHYHHRPKTQAELVALINSTTRGHAFFVGHQLYRAFDPRLPGCAIVTQLRHPLSRVLSVHSWLKMRHARFKSKNPYPTLEKWVADSKGSKYSQVVQLAVGFGEYADKTVAADDLKALLERALENVESHFTWCGFAEHFEESIFVLARLCGLESVLPWQKDDRNAGREPVSSLTAAQRDLIRNVFWADFELYDRLLARFQERIAGMTFSDDLAAYRQACASQYKDRIVTDSPQADQ